VVDLNYEEKMDYSPLLDAIENGIKKI